MAKMEGLFSSSCRERSEEGLLQNEDEEEPIIRINGSLKKHDAYADPLNF